ncbi:acetolactate synthase large subunit [Burkholderia pseudomultivorans]|uniref:acetolactate synthase large subunit n=1 Tax=Burkholderia pseudomultivorans TaxID=1207504 RepID=UPI002874B1AD|nr:acetolactate synthase large subunit [Burkholderia pseudomultivorans]MDS0861353.1 acetolactate synthase large subunit [Burkholderia pseudomultivorans]
MNGAESLVATLVDRGVDICFANPGTSEMHFLAGLENPRMRSVLCLFEGVATGAADGWYRMRDTPASTLLHLGPGLANGLANIHNAKRASSGMVNIIGEHSTSHLKYDPPLTSDIEGLARPMSHWVRRADSAGAIAWDAAKAVDAASAHPGRIATLILPGDASWREAGAPAVPPRPQSPRSAPDVARVEHVARVLRSGEPTLIILGNKATRGAALLRAGKVAAATGARLGSQFFTARIERGAGRVPLERIPYAVAPAQAFLKDFKHIVTVETGEPVAFFSYPDKPSLLKREGTLVHRFVEADEDSALAFEMLLDALGAGATAPLLQPRVATPVPSGALDPVSIAHALAAALPEDCIVVDESLTTGRETMGYTMGAAPHDLINNLGGSIGYATPVATGAALACPDRRVFCMVGDGSAMYTIQSLWTQARENLNVTTIIFANNSYAILKAEYSNMGAGTPGECALSMIDIDRPRIDWRAMAKSMGVRSIAVDTAEAFHAAMVESAREAGPCLIEVRL